MCDFARPELIQAYLNSDLFVFASKVEYSPLVLFESAAAGLPFLSIPVGNAEEIADWTGGGLICPAATDERGYCQVDIQELAGQISMVCKQSELLRSLSANGRRNWEQRFTWDRISRSYEELFEECVQKIAV